MMGPAKRRRLPPVGIGVSIRLGTASSHALRNLERIVRRRVRYYRKFVRMFGSQHVVRVVEIKG